MPKQMRIIKSIEIGDIIEIHHQELIPVDSYLSKGEALIDYSFISGESVPILKQEGDKLYAGAYYKPAQSG